MADTFNAHEILSRLRAKTASAGQASPSNANLTSSNQAMNQSFSSAAASQRAPQNSSSSSNKGVKASNPNANASNAPSSALSLLKQDSGVVRMELEKEIKRLQEEVSSLRQENRQLQQDKEDVERQLIELRVKSEEAITKLRGKIAAGNIAHYAIKADGNGKMYPPTTPPSTGKASSHARHSVPPNMHAYMSPSQSPPPPPVQGDETFREPTFSELMRRSTPEFAAFQDSLRKSRGSTVRGSTVRGVAAMQPAAVGALPPGLSNAAGLSNINGSAGAGHGAGGGSGGNAALSGSKEGLGSGAYPGPFANDASSSDYATHAHSHTHTPYLFPQGSGGFFGGAGGPAASGNSNPAYSAPHPSATFLAEFDRSLPIVEIDLSK